MFKAEAVRILQAAQMVLLQEVILICGQITSKQIHPHFW